MTIPPIIGRSPIQPPESTFPPLTTNRCSPRASTRFPALRLGQPSPSPDYDAVLIDKSARDNIRRAASDLCQFEKTSVWTILSHRHVRRYKNDPAPDRPLYQPLTMRSQHFHCGAPGGHPILILRRCPTSRVRPPINRPTHLCGVSHRERSCIPFNHRHHPPN